MRIVWSVWAQVKCDGAYSREDELLRDSDSNTITNYSETQSEWINIKIMILQQIINKMMFFLKQKMIIYMQSQIFQTPWSPAEL